MDAFLKILVLQVSHFGKSKREILDQVRKRREPTNDEDPLNRILKPWIWDQYLPENMKRGFGKILQPRNHTTKKP